MGRAKTKEKVSWTCLMIGKQVCDAGMQRTKGTPVANEAWKSG